jgi:hypothetical protein
MTSNVVICKHARQYKIIVNNQKLLKEIMNYGNEGTDDSPQGACRT